MIHGLSLDFSYRAGILQVQEVVFDDNYLIFKKVEKIADGIHLFRSSESRFLQ